MAAVLASIGLVPGLALGSFLNVIVARVPLRRSIVHPPSACMTCGVEIAWYDNVPVVSYFVLRGRCRDCGAHIPARYLLIEVTTGALVAASLLFFGAHATALVAIVFCASLVAVSAIDFEYRIIPNRIVVPAAAIVLVARTAIDPSPEWALAALAAGGFLFLAILVYPSGMGMGDVKLALLLGAMLGRTVGVALMIGMLAALVPAVVLMVRHGSAARKMALPFGPFLAFGGLVALFAGEPLLDAYLSTF